jgi:hypothetical protein
METNSARRLVVGDTVEIVAADCGRAVSRGIHDFDGSQGTVKGIRPFRAPSGESQREIYVEVLKLHSEAREGRKWVPESGCKLI